MLAALPEAPPVLARFLPGSGAGTFLLTPLTLSVKTPLFFHEAVMKGKCRWEMAWGRHSMGGQFLLAESTATADS